MFQSVCRVFNSSFKVSSCLVDASPFAIFETRCHLAQLVHSPARPIQIREKKRNAVQMFLKRIDGKRERPLDMLAQLFRDQDAIASDVDFHCRNEQSNWAAMTLSMKSPDFPV